MDANEREQRIVEAFIRHLGQRDGQVVSSGGIAAHGEIKKLFKELQHVNEPIVKTVHGKLQRKPDGEEGGTSQSGSSAGAEPTGGTTNDWLFLAMTYFRSGDADQARKWLQLATRNIDGNTEESMDSEYYSQERIPWTQRLEQAILRREAESLILAREK